MIHETAQVSPRARIGEGTKVWNHSQIREDVTLGTNCIVGKDVYIDFGVTIGNNVKIQNGVYVYHGATIEDGVFLGPRACLTNDKIPRAISMTGTLKTDADWQVGKILIRTGASVGAGAIILPNVTIGMFAMIGAGSVVTRNVPDYGLVLGNPARLTGLVCQCGNRLIAKTHDAQVITMQCQADGFEYAIPSDIFTQMRD